jgi:hypothetical protein
MTSASSLLRTLLIYAICVPLAIFVGYLIASPDPTRDLSTYVGVGLVLFLLSVPLLLRWHRLLMIACWNTCALLYFVPGRPELWLALMWLSLVISLLQYILNPRVPFLSVPSITRPLIFVAVVTLVTAKCSGGFGLGALGSETMGGKKYLIIFTAIAGYFALVSQPIPPRKAFLYVMLFFLGYLTYAASDLASVLGPAAYFIFWFFPPNSEGVHNILTSPGAPDVVTRYSGLAPAATACVCVMLARFGIEEILNPRRIPRLLLFTFFVAVGLLGGFRGVLVQFLLLLTILFYIEGLFRSKVMPPVAIGFLLVGTLVIGFATRMPLSLQRTLSVLPIEVDSRARESAEASSNWRVDMWREVIPEIPKCLLLGRGFGLSNNDIRVFSTGRPGEEQFSGEGSAKAGDFHNGPLSVIITFGIWGVIGFVWLIAAGWRVLYRNYKFGHPDLLRINRFLFAFFVMKTVFFLAVFGSFYSDLVMFTGLIGLSIAINAGVAKPFRISTQMAKAPARPPLNRPRPVGPPAPSVSPSL